MKGRFDWENGMGKFATAATIGLALIVGSLLLTPKEKLYGPLMFLAGASTLLGGLAIGFLRRS